MNKREAKETTRTRFGKEDPRRSRRLKPQKKTVEVYLTEDDLPMEIQDCLKLILLLGRLPPKKH